MSAAIAARSMTAEELLALPEDGAERWLIRGELRERRDTDMTMRNKPHSITEGRIAGHLFVWRLSQPEPRGEVVCGEAGFLLRRLPDTVSAGVDVACLTAAHARANSAGTTLIDGPPVLIAEVLSPHDTQEDVAERVAEYLDCGVPLVWVFSPLSRTVMVHRTDVDPEPLGSKQLLTGGQELPGFSVPVAEFFL